MVALTSSFGWLAFKSSEIDDARALLRAMSEEGVRDELGFLALAGAFADRFYPATNTNMKWSRYLFFVPAVYRHIERRSARERVDATKLARTMQDQLRAALVLNEHVGVIGSSAKEKVELLPSTAYWSALRELGIFCWDTFESSYQDELGAPTRRSALKDDNDAFIGADDDSPWDPAFRSIALADTGGVFAPDTNFRLTRTEARELRDRWAALDERRRLGPSLLTHLVTTSDAWRAVPSAVAWPWDAPRLTTELQPAVEYARLVSLCARGMVLQYHQMLLERRKSFGLEQLPDDMRPPFIAWWDRAREWFSRWDADELSVLLAKWEVRPRTADLKFISDWLRRLAATKHAEALFDDRAARELIRKREADQRPNKARLRSRVHLKQWAPRRNNEDLFELSYRHRVGFQFAQDIVEGLGS